MGKAREGEFSEVESACRFSEDLGSVPNCHGRQLTTTCDSKLWFQEVWRLLLPSREPAHMWHMVTPMHIQINIKCMVGDLVHLNA